jgi:hypothetical protein
MMGFLLLQLHPVDVKWDMTITPIPSITRPWPITRPAYQSTSDRIIVAIYDFLLNNPVASAIMVITTSLPDGRVAARAA